MEVYILDSLYRRIDLVDSFDSLIWTERFSAFGDFQLTVHSTLANRRRFTAGTRLAMDESYRVMTVETIEDTTDADGKALLKLSGRSLEAILDDRLAWPGLNNTTVDPRWILTEKPANLARFLFHVICVDGIVDPGDRIPNVIEGSLFTRNTIAEPTDTITVGFDPASLYASTKNLCDLYDLGFRFIRNFDTGLLYYDIYTGNDLTTGQTIYPAVVFSPSLDNLQNTTEVTTIATYKNVAYVITPVGSKVVYATDVPSDTSGLDRRALVVNASDITDPDPVVANAQMLQRGIEELSKNRRISAFDGEINQNGSYRYGVDYNLGDIVETRNIDGITNDMRVTEQIFTSDATGEKSYPTLTLKTFITPGSWLAYNPTKHWVDLNADTTSVWGNQE